MCVCADCDETNSRGEGRARGERSYGIDGYGRRQRDITEFGGEKVLESDTQKGERGAIRTASRRVEEVAHEVTAEKNALTPCCHDLLAENHGKIDVRFDISVVISLSSAVHVVHGEQLQGEIPRERTVPLFSTVFHGFHIHDGSVCACKGIK